MPILADFSKRRGITFPLLSDPGSATIKRYGILNTTVPETNQQSYGIPFPGTFMLNTQGVVTSRFFEQAYQERSTVGSIMARLGNKVEVQATTVSSPQLELTSFATDSTVAPGTQFSLVLDLRPARGIHVYAPGVTGYKPIALSVQPQPGLLTRGALYPPSEDYHFKPLNEHVQVYQRPFRIVQDVLIDASPQAPDRVEGCDVDDDQRRPQLPGLRRQGVFHAPDGAAHVDGERFDNWTASAQSRDQPTRVPPRRARRRRVHDWSRSRLRRHSRRPPHASRHRL